jgi:hypothetical protein
MSDHCIAEAATYTRHDKHKRRTFMLTEGLENAIPPIEQLQTYASDCTATAISIGLYDMI